LEIIVKVDARKVSEPAAHVGRAVARAVAGAGIEIEEVFPGLRTGRSAGLVSLRLPDGLAAPARESLIEALREDEAVEYVETPKPRRPR
jgi:hypothetical protein